ncbi:hypothetical protein [Microbacterium sp. NPDC087591]|uniref:hypothetical protein n=1 Tax=Microbacterium sp. NPDC087591 TaxID=3364192 RepID=UPI0037F3EB0B
MTREMTPRSYVEAQERWSPASWWHLESHLFRDEPEVRMALWFRAPADARRAFAARHFSLGGLLLSLAEIASLLLPALALVTLVSRHWVDGQPDLVRSGVLAGLAAALSVVGMIARRSRPEGVDARTERLVAVVHIVPSLIVLVLGVMFLTSGAVDGSAAWALAGPVIDIALSVVRWRRNRPAADAAAERASKEDVRLDRALATIAPERSVALRAELHEALKLASARGLVGPEETSRAERAPFGRLGVTMAPARPPVADVAHG